MRKHSLISVFTVIAAGMLLSSCYYNKRMIYLQDQHLSEEMSTRVVNQKRPYRLQPFDILSIQIKSSAERDVTGIFNVASPQGSMFASPGNFFLDGYSVDTKGKIVLPVIGELTVKDLTVEEVQTLVQSHASKYLNRATVFVKLTSFKITVLGEVKTPGQYFVYNNQATVLEGLGMAGDLTNFGNREKVKLIRQVPEGSEMILLDLTDGDLLESHYFYLMPGDVLYVEPIKTRSNRENLDLLSLLFAGLTTAVLILGYMNNN
jgi:polysaccharide export outer membrane protein